MIENNFKNRNLIFIVESFRIGLKAMREYKINLYFGLLTHFFFTSVTFLSLFVVVPNLTSFDLNISQLFFLVIYGQCFAMFGALFRYGGAKLGSILLDGQMNVFLTKPINIFLQYLFFGNPYYVCILLIIDICLMLFSGFYFGFINDFFVFLSALFVSFFGAIFYVLVHKFFESFTFFSKEISFIKQVYNNVERVFHQFPFLMFDNYLKFLGFFVGFSVYGIVPVLWIFGLLDLSIFIFYFLLMIFFIVVFSFSIFLLWHYGLKRYEAFG